MKHAKQPVDTKSLEKPASDKQELQAQGEATLPKPQGIGMAVAFDWGLAVQILVTPFITQNVGNISFIKSLKLSQPLATGLFLLISLPFVALVAVFGEGVRRGWRWTRFVQIGVNSLGFLGGIFTLFRIGGAVKVGNYWPVVTAVILLIFSPLIAWRLSRPVTEEWFAQVSSTQARRHHGGLWPWLILLWSIVGGVLQAIAALK